MSKFLISSFIQTPMRFEKVVNLLAEVFLYFCRKCLPSRKISRAIYYVVYGSLNYMEVY